MNKLFFVLTITMTFILNGQELKKYYKLPDGQIFTNKVYNHFVNNDNIKSQLKFSIRDSIKRQDSLIYLVNITPLKKAISLSNDTIKEKQNIEFNPYAKYDSLIGTKFKIENYITKKGKKFKSSYLNNKPTIINFWFTRCPPCIMELPNLNNIKKEIGGDINYLAITFEDTTLVNNFLAKHKFNFFHITNSKKEIDRLKINTYPLTMILNKKGIIVEVFPDIYNSEKEVIKKLKELL